MAGRPKFRKYFEISELAHLWRKLYAIKAIERIVVGSALTDLCADPKDDFLLNLCLDARPDALVTGDRLVREAVVRPEFQPLLIWSLAELRAYITVPVPGTEQ